MATFQYQGTDRSGKLVRGLVSADTIRSARDQLRENGLSIRRIEPRLVRQRVNVSGLWKRRRYASSLTSYIRELTTLLQAGIPLIDAMDSCSTQVATSLRSSLSALRDRVSEGQNLAEAMSQERWLFDDMMIGMVRVGEHAGNLEEVLDQIASFREQSEQLRDRVLSAVLYPAIVLTVSIGVSLFLMTVVVPMLLKNLTELGRELPWPTRVLQFLSDGLLAHGWWLSLALGVLCVGILTWMQSPAGKLRTAKAALRLPLLGQLIRKQAIGRVSLVIACLLRSGVELVEAIEIAESSCANDVIRQALTQIRLDIETGAGLREAVAKHPVFPATFAQIFAIGQQSGQLDSMLERLGRDYDRQAAVLASRMTSVAEPLLILLLSIIVGFILFATVLPILEAGNVLAN